jgi:hypothetical protein
MTKTVEEVRRAAFESVFPRNGLTLDPDGLYSGEWASFYNAKWQGFNAALDAVEIQLPGAHEAMKAVFDYQHGASNKNVTGTTNWAANVGMVVVGDCRTAIEQTGLGLRVK